MTTETNWALQRAIFQILSQSVDLQEHLGSPPRIVDTEQVGLSLPFLVIGEGRSTDWGNVSGGLEHELRFHVIARSGQTQQAKHITGIIRQLLHDADFPVDGAKLVNIRLTFSDTWNRLQNNTVQAVLRFRVITHADSIDFPEVMEA